VFQCFSVSKFQLRFNRVKRLLIALLFCYAGYASGQGRAIPFRFSVGNEATAIPYTKFISLPVHPSFQAGTEFQYKNSSHHYLYQTVNIGYIFHNHLYQGIYVSSEIGYDYKFAFGLNFKALFGLGYLHTFTTQQEYRFKNGEFVKGADRGNARLMPSLSIGAGYRFDKDADNSPEIFLLYQSWIEYPYSPGFIPVMTHICLQLGVKFFIVNNRQDEK
jgi:hypothetical protein